EAETSCTGSISASVRSLMCSWTPPGPVPAVWAGQADLHDQPSLRAAAAPLGGGQPRGVEVGGEHVLQHVPVLRMSPDTCLEEARDLLRHRRRLLLLVAFGRHRDLLMNVHAPAVALEPQDRGHQRRAGLHGERGRAAHHAGLLAEELHLDAAAGDIAVADQAYGLAGPQPL